MRSEIIYFRGGCPAKVQLQGFNPTMERRGRGSTVIVFTNPLFNPYVILTEYIVLVILTKCTPVIYKSTKGTKTQKTFCVFSLNSLI